MTFFAARTVQAPAPGFAVQVANRRGGADENIDLQGVHRMIRRCIVVLAAIAVGTFCAHAADGKTLYVLTWEKYFDENAVKIFEAAHGCSVEFDYYDSNELIFRTLESGGGYDVITPSPNVAARLRRAGLVRDLDHSLLPNLKHLGEKVREEVQDAEMRYSVPYTLTFIGVGYNRDSVPPEALGGWDIFANADLRGKMAMLNDTREVVGAALKHLGFSVNSTNPEEVEAAGRVLSEWRKNLYSFDVNQALEELNSGSLAAIQAYSGDIARISEGNPNIGFYIPAEGSSVNLDEFVIGTDSEQPELAHAFINHFLNPVVAAMNMNSIHYHMPNPEALEMTSGEFRSNPALNLPEEATGRCEAILDIGDAIEVYDTVFLRAILGE